MIIDTPLLASIALGTDRVVPQEGDGQVVIPSAIAPVIFPIQPHFNIVPVAVDVQRGSVLTLLTATKLNVVSAIDTVITLAKGLWRIEVNFSVRANFTSLVLSDVTAVRLFFPVGGAVSIAALNLPTVAGNIEFSRELLLTQDTLLQVTTPATNAVATNSIGWTIMVNAIRRI